jgi:hypothetical protein
MAEREPSDATKRLAMVERTCRECKGSGVAEYIDHWARPCDTCHGEGFLRFTTNEDGLLDQCESLSARVAELAEALEQTTDLLARYREETPPGHSPHMICHLADAAIEKSRTALRTEGDAPGDDLRETLRSMADELDGLIPYLASHHYDVTKLTGLIGKARGFEGRSRD